MHGMITEQVELFEYFGCEISPRRNDGKFNPLNTELNPICQ